MDVQAQHALPQPTTLPPQRGGRWGFALLVGLVAAAAAGKVVLFDTMDPDAFWHLRVAEQLVQSGFWPRPLVDDLSFMTTRQPWAPYSWLAERGMKALWDAGGYRLAIATQAAMEAGFIVLLALASLEMTRIVTGAPRRLAAALACLMGALLSLGYMSFRPNTLAIFLLAQIGYLLLRDRRMEQQSRAVWLTPVLTAILANVHFFSIIALLWTIALLVGDAIQNRLPEAGSPPRRLGRGLLLAGLCALGCTMTPLLGGTVQAIGQYLFDDALVNSNVIIELGPFYRGTMGHVAAVLVIAMAACLIWKLSRPASGPALRRRLLGELLWLGGMSILLIRMGRMMPMFAIIAAPIFAATMPELSDRLLKKPLIVGACSVILVMMLVRIALAFPSAREPISAWLTRLGPDVPTYPCGAADYVERNVHRESGRLVCDFGWGGYLEWRLGPGYQALADGRTNLFGKAFWHSTYLCDDDRRQAFLKTIGADAAIVPASGGTFGKALQGLKWKTVYTDPWASVMVPPNDRAGLADDR